MSVSSRSRNPVYENSLLDASVEQPHTFSLLDAECGDSVGSAIAVTKASGESAMQSPQPHFKGRAMTNVNVSENKVLTRKDLAAANDDRMRNEDEFREWLTDQFRSQFDAYRENGGMPNEIFLTNFAKRDMFRNRKLSQLVTQIDKNHDGRITWEEFFSFMTYRKRTEVPRRRRLLNSLVRSAAPAAAKEDHRVRRRADLDGEPVPDEAYLEFYDCRPPPIFVPLLLVAIWTFFIIYLTELNQGPEWNRVTWMGGIPYYSPLVFCPARRHEAWRFISYMLLHVGWHHILFNSAMTLILGIPLELVHKAWRVAPIFLCGVLSGSLLSSILEPAVTLMGASGGVYALIGAHYGLVLMNWEELQQGWLQCKRGPVSFLSSGVFRLLALSALVALDFGVALYRRYAEPNVRDSASLTAHAAGLVCGVLVGIPALRNIDVKPWERVLLWIAVVLCSLFLVFAIFWNIFYRSYPTNIPCNTGATG